MAAAKRPEIETMMRKLFTILLFTITFFGAQAQVEEVVDLTYRAMWPGGIKWNTALSFKQQADTLTLPFIDDFSYRSNYPDTAFWADRQVYINNDYPINKISYGVATFDGVDSIGKPYRQNVNLPTDGGADTLTSKLINISSLNVDDSVYLSFSFQPMGLGDYPDRGDSLMLEFSLDDTTWVNVWAVNGTNSRPVDPQFTQVFVLLDNLFYFRNDFRFRFRNRATITGNNDHWHLDYVFMDANRTITDTVLRDVSVLEEPTSFLKNFTMMPWKQFKGHETTEVDSNVTLCYRNNFSTNTSTDFRYQAFAKVNGSAATQLFASSIFNYNALPQSDSCFSFSAMPYVNALPSASDNDSVLVTVKTFVNNVGGDISKSNDTVINPIEFYNLMAYDDGTAEKGYGLAGAAGLKRFAMEFTLNEPDTLRAVLIHFTRINTDVTNELFSFFVWGALPVNNDGSASDTIYSIDFQRPKYVDSLNGFATFVLPDAPVVNGTIYVGWQQISEKNLQVGMDIQNSARQHMYYFSNNTWFNSQIAGAPMIRPLFGKDVPLVGIIEPMKPTAENRIKVYPNPVIDQLYLEVPSNEYQAFTVQVFDISGKLMLEQRQSNNSIATSSLQAGMYLVKVIDSKGSMIRTARFIKI
ncbi:hypothetical protein BH09BAC1_BH09BAC1_08370 [soil metagenome]